MRKDTNVVLFGTGFMAEVAHFYLTKDSRYKVVAFTVDRSHLTEKEKFGLPVVPFEEVSRLYPPNKNKFFVAIGYTNQNRVRATKYFEAKKEGYELISYVCSKAITWDDLEIGDNCFVFEANVIQPYVKIGNDVIIWSGNHIGHHSAIGDHCFVTSHTVISGDVRLGPYCFVGVNSTLTDGLRVSEGDLIGAGALLVKDTEPWSVYVGAPARVMKRVENPTAG